MRPGHAITLWFAIFNAPERCSDGVCGPDDVFADPADHSAGPNAAQIAATRASVVGRATARSPTATADWRSRGRWTSARCAAARARWPSADPRTAP